jgi:peptide/nickel transport system substrate-binding protein
MSKKIIALLVSVILLFACVGCSNAGSQTSGKDGTTTTNAPVKDTLVISIEQEGNDFDPMSSGVAMSTSGVIRNVYEGLVRCNADGSVRGILATSWTWASDGMSIDFKLREGVKFTNGETFNADDVIYSLKDRYPTSSTGKSEVIFDFPNIKKVGDYEVVIPLKKSASDALNLLTQQKYSIMNKKAVDAAGSLAGSKPIGTGPYLLDQWVQGDKIVLKANDNYWGGKAKLKTITIRIIKESSQAEIELESGNVDAVITGGNNDVIRVQKGEVKGLKSVSIFGGVNALQFNFKKSFANNVLVRQALNYAIDRNAIAQADSSGLNTPVYQPGIPTQPCYIQDYVTNPPYPYNPEKAKALLAQAGYANGLTLELYSDVGAAAVSDGQLLKNMFAKVGVTLNLHALEAGTFVPIALKGEEDDVLLSIGIGDNTGSILQRFRSASDPKYSPDFDQSSSSNVYSEIFTKFSQAGATLDQNKAIDIMKECGKMEVEQALTVPLNSSNTYVNCVSNLNVEWNYGDPNFFNWYYN